MFFNATFPFVQTHEYTQHDLSLQQSSFEVGDQTVNVATREGRLLIGVVCMTWKIPSITDFAHHPLPIPPNSAPHLHHAISPTECRMRCCSPSPQLAPILRQMQFRGTYFSVSSFYDSPAVHLLDIQSHVLLHAKRDSRVCQELFLLKSYTCY